MKSEEPRANILSKRRVKEIKRKKIEVKKRGKRRGKEPKGLPLVLHSCSRGVDLSRLCTKSGILLPGPPSSVRPRWAGAVYLYLGESIGIYGVSPYYFLILSAVFVTFLVSFLTEMQILQILTEICIFRHGVASASAIARSRPRMSTRSLSAPLGTHWPQKGYSVRVRVKVGLGLGLGLG